MAEIVSSTGGEGLARRSYNRWYYNRTDGVVARATEVTNYFAEIGSRWWRRSTRRDVMRGIAKREVVEELIVGTTHLIEVAFPIQEDLYYFNAAQRYGRRNPLRPVDEMVGEVRNSSVSFGDPVETVQNVLNEGYRFVNQIPTKQNQRDLLKLWGKTFGWNKKQIRNFAARLESGDPTVWFSAIQDRDGHLVAAAMAEGLSIHIGEGRTFDFVESTEWRSTKRDHMKAVLDHLHAQVMNSYEESGKEYLILAECNVNSRSYRAAQKSGMVMPDSGDLGVSQILVQNVKVVDGKKPRGRLRDFVFMQLPRENYPIDKAREVLFRAA